MPTVKVKPQPKNEEALWPNDRAHVEWWEIMAEPDYYGHAHLGDLVAKADTVSLDQDQKGEWYWVIERG